MFVKSVDSMASTTYCMYFSDNQWQFHELLAWQEQARSVQEDFNRRSSSSDVTFMPGILPLEAPGTSNIVALNDQSLCTILWAGDAGINSGYLFVSMSHQSSSSPAKKSSWESRKWPLIILINQGDFPSKVPGFPFLVLKLVTRAFRFFFFFQFFRFAATQQKKSWPHNSWPKQPYAYTSSWGRFIKTKRIRKLGPLPRNNLF